MSETYPPQPWNLAGQMYLSVWAVPVRQLGGGLPPGTTAIGFGRFALVGVAWVRYQAGSVLEYDELLAAVRRPHGPPFGCVVGCRASWQPVSPSASPTGRRRWTVPSGLGPGSTSRPRPGSSTRRAGWAGCTASGGRCCRYTFATSESNSAGGRPDG